MGKNKKGVPSPKPASSTSSKSSSKSYEQRGTDTLDQVAQGGLDWNTQAHQIAGEAQGYAQNNPYSQAAQGWITGQLGGSMASNPWMQDLYGDIGQVNPYGTFQYLADYAGIPGGGQGTAPGKPGGLGSSSSGSSSGRGKSGRPLASFGGSEDSGNSGYHGSSSSYGGSQDGANYVPDTITGSDSYFANQARALFDPATLDPANDPTLQPVIDAIQREAREDYLGNIAGLDAQAEGAGRFGGGLYQAMIGQQTEEQQEAVSQAIAGQLMGAYQSQRERQMQGLGLINQRDLGAMSDMTSRAAIDAQSSAAGAAASAAAAEAAEQRKLQATGMLLNAQMGLVGMRGDMASLMQTGQQNAAQLGLGYGQLGMSGYDTALNAGQLGLGGLQLAGGVGQGYMDYGLNKSAQAMQRQSLEMQQQSQAYNQRMQGLGQQQDALNDYLNILMGIGGMGNTSSGSQPGQYQATMDPWAAGGMGAAGGFIQGYGATGGTQNSGWFN